MPPKSDSTVHLELRPGPEQLTFNRLWNEFVQSIILLFSVSVQPLGFVESTSLFLVGREFFPAPNRRAQLGTWRAAGGAN